MKKFSVKRIFLGFSGDIPFWRIKCPKCPWYVYSGGFSEAFDKIDRHIEDHVSDRLTKIFRSGA